MSSTESTTPATCKSKKGREESKRTPLEEETRLSRLTWATQAPTALAQSAKGNLLTSETPLRVSGEMMDPPPTR